MTQVNTQPDFPAALQWQLQAAGLPIGTRELRFHESRKWRFDLAWPEQLLAVEIDGGIWARGRHVSGVGFQQDIEKLNEAAMAGWRVMRFTPRMVEDGKALAIMERILGHQLKTTLAPASKTTEMESER
jgi:very-short-patch-repair endonuclease